MLDEPDPEKEGVREALPLVDHMAEGDLQGTFDKPADHPTLGKIIEGGMLSQEKYYEKANPSKKNSVTRNDSNWGYNVKTRQKQQPTRSLGLLTPKWSTPTTYNKL